jgi:hypothetical protein
MTLLTTIYVEQTKDQYIFLPLTYMLFALATVSVPFHRPGYLLIPCPSLTANPSRHH